MANAEFIKQARKPNLVVTQEDIDAAKSGEDGRASYWKWSFRFGGTHYSKTRPRPSQLTQSEFFSGVYAIQESMEDASPKTQEDLEALRDEWVNEVEDLAEGCRERYENMPEGFQQGATGEILTERIDAMEAWANELECIDLTYNDEEEECANEAERVEERLEKLHAVEPGI